MQQPTVPGKFEVRHANYHRHRVAGAYAGGAYGIVSTSLWTAALFEHGLPLVSLVPTFLVLASTYALLGATIGATLGSVVGTIHGWLSRQLLMTLRPARTAPKRASQLSAGIFLVNLLAAVLLMALPLWYLLAPLTIITTLCAIFLMSITLVATLYVSYHDNND